MNHKYKRPIALHSAAAALVYKPEVSHRLSKGSSTARDVSERGRRTNVVGHLRMTLVGGDSGRITVKQWQRTQDETLVFQKFMAGLWQALE